MWHRCAAWLHAALTGGLACRWCSHDSRARHMFPTPPCRVVMWGCLQDPVVVLVKEYLPGSKAVAINELQVWYCPAVHAVLAAHAMHAMPDVPSVRDAC